MIFCFGMDCPFCFDVATRRLTCGHNACTLCLADLIDDGAICKTPFEDCDIVCNTSFLPEEVTVIQHIEQHDPMDSEDHESVSDDEDEDEHEHEHEHAKATREAQDVSNAIKNQIERMSQCINAVDTLRDALFGHRDYTKITGQPTLVFGSEGSGDGQFAYPKCILFDKDNNILVGEHNFNQRIQVLNQQGQHVRYFATGLGSTVTGLTMTPDGNMWVALHDTKTLQLRNGATGDLISYIQLQDSPCGITLTADGASLAVSFIDAKKVIFINVVDGTQLWESTGNEKFSNGLNGITIANNEVFVCDPNNHQLQVLSLTDGSFVHSIGGRGKMKYPSSVTIDAVSHVLLVGESDKVSVWSLEGVRLHWWGTLGNQPGQVIGVDGITVSPVDGSVWIADTWNHRVQVF